MLGAWRDVRVTEAAAAEKLAFDEPDFRAAAWFVGADGKSAAAVSADGEEVALVFVVGDSYATRRLVRSAVRAEQAEAVLRFRLGEASRPTVLLLAPDAATSQHWLSRLTRGG